MPHKLLSQASALPKDTAIWHVAVRRSPAWIAPKNKPPYRPFMVLVVNAANGRIRGSHMQENRPQVEEVLKTLADAMVHPIPGGGKRARPARILLDDAALVEQLAPYLAEIDVRCEHHSGSAMIAAAVRAMTAHLNPGPQRPALSGMRGMTLPLLAEFYTAAAQFHRQAPWRWLDNLMPIELHYPADGPAWYVVVMGGGGDSYGLAFYRSLADLKLQYTIRDPQRIIEKITSFSVTFDDPTYLAFEDLDAIEEHGWPVNGPAAYPWIMKVMPPARIVAATLDEVVLCAAALRAVPGFVTGNLAADKGVPLAADATFSLPDVYGGQEIRLCYPVDLPDIWALPGRKLDYQELDEMIAQWYWDERSRVFARQLGAFLLGFLDSLDTRAISDTTLRKYESNCWFIGKLICYYGGYQTFLPTIFLSKPAYQSEFQQNVSESRQALASYEDTWRALTEYVRLMGYVQK